MRSMHSFRWYTPATITTPWIMEFGLKRHLQVVHGRSRVKCPKRFTQSRQLHRFITPLLRVFMMPRRTKWRSATPRVTRGLTRTMARLFMGPIMNTSLGTETSTTAGAGHGVTTTLTSRGTNGGFGVHHGVNQGGFELWWFKIFTTDGKAEIKPPLMLHVA